MAPEIEQLVREVMELTGARQPGLLEDDAPVLSQDALRDDDSFYLVGLIGGKEVGKSALVNALAGRDITVTTSYGPGTEGVVAYAHVSQEKALGELLDRVVPGQYRIVMHELPALRRQVLLDLPDIDSHFASHLQVTRTMLRHMLFPVWIVSVEKYADRQPQQMLARVAAGNVPDNFIFCLNKVDQLRGDRVDAEPVRQLEAAVAELRDDYAGRVQRTLNLDSPPHVYMVSALEPQRFDLTELRAIVARQKSSQVVKQSQALAARRQDGALLAWLDHQQLPMHAKRLRQLQHDAEELVAQRVGEPLLDEVVPRLLDDAGSRGAMTDEILDERVAHWPVVRLVHTLLSPLFLLVRGMTSRTAAPLQAPAGLVEIVLRESGLSLGERIETTFAQLRQSQPTMARLYADARLWERMSADRAAAELQGRLAATVRRQREVARTRVAHGRRLWAPARWLLTFGALIWFPFAQPILQAALPAGLNAHWTWSELAYLTVRVLGVDYLLKSVGFLCIYFLVLWLALRWNTQRGVARLLARWKLGTVTDPSLNLSTQTIQWMDSLVQPIKDAADRMESLAERTASARKLPAQAA